MLKETLESLIVGQPYLNLERIQTESIQTTISIMTYYILPTEIFLLAII